jgi:hypothetical protein
LPEWAEPSAVPQLLGLDLHHFVQELPKPELQPLPELPPQDLPHVQPHQGQPPQAALQSLQPRHR